MIKDIKTEINGLKKVKLDNENYSVKIEFFNRFDYADFIVNLLVNDWRDDTTLYLHEEEKEDEEAE